MMIAAFSYLSKQTHTLYCTPPALMAPPRLRILCLHAFQLSGDTMSRQLTQFSNFAKSIDDLAELHFVDGGHRLPDEVGEKMPERLRQLFPPPYYEWWNAREEADGSVVYDHLDASLTKLQQHVAAHGPFDGLLGFSQGGSVAHLLALLSLREPAFEFWPPRFGIFLSARTTRHAAHAALLADAVTTPLPLPSLVIYGGNDGDVPAAMTRELMTTLDPGRTTEIYLPEGTHRIPKLSEEHRESVRAFLQAQQEAIAIAKESQA